jgi:hypothetical protein
MRFLARARDRFLASDPAFSRLRMASRALLSLLLAAATLTGFHFFIHPLPVAAFGLGIVLSMMGSMMIRDDTSHGQLVSRAYAGIGAFGAVALAAALFPWPIAAYGGFLAVIFVAVYIRRFGPRWFAVGMLAFMAYFMGDYLHPKAADLGWIALAAVLALATTHLVTTLLLRDDPERDFRRAIATVNRRIDLILGKLQDHAGEGIAESDRKSLRQDVADLREAVLMAEGFIPQGDGGALAGEGPAARLALALFELQLATERIIGASFEAVPQDALLAAARQGDVVGLEHRLAELKAANSGAADSAILLIRLVAAREKLDRHLARSPAPAFEDGPELAAPGAPESGGTGASSGGAGWIPQSFQLPIQITAATGAAMAGGLLLSPVRWYWAVITAFIVFNNTQSRSDTLVRAAQRSFGTLGGLIVGSLAATVLAGHTIVSVATILLLFFVGFYFVQVSYSMMMLCITIALALIYGVMGMFTPELLVLRLEETLIGAAAGVGAAFVLFGRRTSVAASEKLADFFDSLSELLGAARARLCGEDGNPDLVALSRKIDSAYVALATVVQPMGGPWRAVTRFGAVRQKLLLLTGCAHWARSLAESLRDQDGQGAFCAPAKPMMEEIEARIAVGREQGPDLFQRPSSSTLSLGAAERQLLSDASPLVALDMLAKLLRRVTE